MNATLLKEKQISNLIRRTVLESVQGILTDPDYGLEIGENVAKRLRKHSRQNNSKTVSLSDIKKKYL